MTQTLNQSDITRAVDETITSRRSIRAFLPDAIPDAIIMQILSVASRAPSGSNTQPWKVYVLTGDSRRSLTQKMLTAHNNPSTEQAYSEEYAYYPRTWVSPYQERRRKIGWDLYSLLGLTRENKAGMHAQHGRNYAFFDAPVGLIFTIDRVMEQGSWLDYGMFLQNIMLAARARGLDTCPQAALNSFHRLISEHLDLPEEQMVVCGMSLGYADAAAVENSLETERDPAEAFTVFCR